MQNKRIIGITDGRMYDLYADWIKGMDTDVAIIRLGYRADNFHAVRQCHALVFTGGEDVYPTYYNRPDYLTYCVPADFDKDRDAFEWRLIAYAEQKALPVLGICRGLQLINVYYGGTLIPDLPTWGRFRHGKRANGDPDDHRIYVNPSTHLFSIAGIESGIVNSLHHQGVDEIGKGLLASAVSEDGVVEALERRAPAGKPFLLLVQWHPERMQVMESPFVERIRMSFLEASFAQVS